MTKVPPEILALPLHLRAEMALKEAVAGAIAEHKRLGVPLVIWRDGKVVCITAEELEKEQAEREARSSSSLS